MASKITKPSKRWARRSWRHWGVAYPTTAPEGGRESDPREVEMQRRADRRRVRLPRAARGPRRPAGDPWMAKNAPAHVAHDSAPLRAGIGVATSVIARRASVHLEIQYALITRCAGAYNGFVSRHHLHARTCYTRTRRVWHTPFRRTPQWPSPRCIPQPPTITRRLRNTKPQRIITSKRRMRTTPRMKTGPRRMRMPRIGIANMRTRTRWPRMVPRTTSSL